MKSLTKIGWWCVYIGLALSAMAQAPAVNQVISPPPFGVQQIFDYASGSNLTYVGYAMSDQIANFTITVSAASTANPVSFTATAHGFDYQSKATVLPAVTITGGTGNWTAINGTWIATPTSANAFTIAVDSTGFGALTGTLVVTTRAPLTTKPIWSISKNVFDASNRLIWTGWASNPPGAGVTIPTAGSTALGYIWNNRASLGYQ